MSSVGARFFVPDGLPPHKQPLPDGFAGTRFFVPADAMTRSAPFLSIATYRHCLSRLQPGWVVVAGGFSPRWRKYKRSRHQESKARLMVSRALVSVGVDGPNYC